MIPTPIRAFRRLTRAPLTWSRTTALSDKGSDRRFQNPLPWTGEGRGGVEAGKRHRGTVSNAPLPTSPRWGEESGRRSKRPVLSPPGIVTAALALGLTGAGGGAVASDAHQGQAAPALAPVELMRLLATMPTGDPARGEELHDTYWCSGCHGTEGIAWSRNYPSLAGQSAAYLFKTMVDYRDGRRAEGDGTALSMKVTVTALDDQALADLAAYYAARPGPAPDPAAAGVETPPEILALIKSGDPSRLMTPCASCHGVGGTGGKPEVPRLAGLEKAYLERSLRLYHGGARASDTDSNMRFFAERLTDKEIEALAIHYSGQGRPATVAAE